MRADKMLIGEYRKALKLMAELLTSMGGRPDKSYEGVEQKICRWDIDTPLGILHVHPCESQSCTGFDVFTRFADVERAAKVMNTSNSPRWDLINRFSGKYNLMLSGRITAEAVIEAFHKHLLTIWRMSKTPYPHMQPA